MGEEERAEKIKSLKKQATKIKQRKDAKVDIPKAIEMRAKGDSYREIAKYQGCSKDAVYNALIPFGEELKQLQEFQANKPQILDALTCKLAERIKERLHDTDRIEQEKLSSLTSALDTLNKNKRLESGESTTNTQILVVDLSRFKTEQ